MLYYAVLHYTILYYDTIQPTTIGSSPLYRSEREANCRVSATADAPEAPSRLGAPNMI